MAFVNIFGLALGMACCALLLLAVRDQLSFDGFHKNASSIYRVVTFTQNASGEERGVAQPIPLTPALKAEIPQVQRATRFTSSGRITVKFGGTPFRETPVFVDADFFRIFSFTFLQGTADAAFQDKTSIVLTKEIADKMFGNNANALGKTVQVQTDGAFKDFLVSGVIADAPENSSLELGLVMRFENVPWYTDAQNSWDSWSHDVYVQLQVGVQPAALNTALQRFTEKHFAEEIATRKQEHVKPNEQGKYVEHHLQPLADVHFNTMIEPTSSIRSFVYVLVGVGAFILLIACINFVNLSVAQSLMRSREVGVRKALGAGYRQIAGQFLGESLLVVVLAAGVSIAIAEMLLPILNDTIRRKLSLFITADGVSNLPFMLLLLFVFVLLGVLAGSYPAFFVARFEAATALKDRSRGVTPTRLRSTLVVVQFTIAVMLIASTMVFSSQTQYLLKKDLGFDRENIVMIPIGNDAKGRETVAKMRNVLRGNANILSITGSGKPIGRGADGSDHSSNSSTSFRGTTLKMALLAVDFDYPETMGIPLVVGRGLSEQFITTDTTQSIVLNEAMARQVWTLLPADEQKKLSPPRGDYSPQALLNFPLIQAPDTTKMLTIVGIIRNFHFESLRKEIRPSMLFALPDANIGAVRYIFARTRAGNTVEAINTLKNVWQQVSPDVPWQGSFVDENIERQYRSQIRQTMLITSSASIAIALSCMGLFALAAIIITQRTKEIGIRKVLGASVSGIIALLTKDFLKLVAIAIVIAVPCAWFAMNAWLRDFAYRIELRSVQGVGIFVAAGVVAVIIAFLTVAIQATRAARANPVEALKSE